MASSFRILPWHRTRLQGRLTQHVLVSDALGIAKCYYVYEAPGLKSADEVPVLYLFRGHEREWVNMKEDSSRKRSTAIQDLDELIVQGALPPLVAVMPGLNSSNNHVPSLGIDMVGTWAAKHKGLGTGNFWTYLVDELLPTVEEKYPRISTGPRLMAGFSLGGYTVSLLATRKPGYFQHAAMYDGTFMWPEHKDPRVQRNGRYTDRIWSRAEIFNPALGKPRDPTAMQQWNTTDALLNSSGENLESLRSTTYWLASAASDGRSGNLDRARFVQKRMQQRGLPLGFGDQDIVYHPDAAHTWHWTDRFLVSFLKGAFGASEAPSDATTPRAAPAEP